MRARWAIFFLGASCGLGTLISAHALAQSRETGVRNLLQGEDADAFEAAWLATLPDRVSVKENFQQTSFRLRRRRAETLAQRFERKNSFEHMSLQSEFAGLTLHLRVDLGRRGEAQGLVIRIDEETFYQGRLPSLSIANSTLRWQSFRFDRVPAGQRILRLTVESSLPQPLFPFTTRDQNMRLEGTLPIFVRAPENDVNVMADFREGVLTLSKLNLEEGAR